MIKITNGEKTFNSIVEASSVLGVNESSIRKALDSPNRRSLGFKWWTVNDSETPESPEIATTIGEISNVDDDLPVSIIDNMYTWKSNGINYQLPIDVADKLFFEFSRHGMDMTALEVRIKNNISLPQWHSLKHRLQLYKESDIFSPATRNDMTDTEYRDMLRNKMRDLDLYKKRAVVDEYNKFHLNQSKAWRDQANKKSFILESITEQLSQWLTDRSEPFKVAESSYPWGGHLVVATADWHMGAGVDKRYNNPVFNKEIISWHVSKIAERVKEEQPQSVTLVLGGDYIETFSGLNHLNSWQGIESGMFGAKAIISAVEIIFEQLIEQIPNVVTVIGVGGNHDRSSASNKEDVMAQIATLAFYFMERMYGGRIRFNYDPFCVTENIGNIKYILQHGNTPSATKTEALVNDYGDPRMFNLVLSADKHTRGILSDGWNKRHVKIPPIFTGNFYSSQLGFSSTSGALLIKEVDGLPQITDISFYSKLQ